MGKAKGVVTQRFYPQVVTIESVSIITLLDLMSNIGGDMRSHVDYAKL